MYIAYRSCGFTIVGNVRHIWGTSFEITSERVMPSLFSNHSQAVDSIPGPVLHTRTVKASYLPGVRGVNHSCWCGLGCLVEDRGCLQEVPVARDNHTEILDVLEALMKSL